MSEELLERFIQIRSENSKYSLEVIKLRNEIEKLHEEIKKKDKIIKEAAYHLEQHLITNRSNYILSWISEGEKALTILKGGVSE